MSLIPQLSYIKHKYYNIMTLCWEVRPAATNLKLLYLRLNNLTNDSLTVPTANS